MKNKSNHKNLLQELQVCLLSFMPEYRIFLETFFFPKKIKIETKIDTMVIILEADHKYYKESGTVPSPSDVCQIVI